MVRLLSFVTLLAAATQAALTYKGADWSSVGLEEAAGRSFKTTSGVTTPLETLLKNNGANTVRQRLWVKSGSQYDLTYNLKLAKRAKAAGLGIFLDMHFSDTWASPSAQTLPSGWPSDIETLTNQLYEYTKSVCNSFASAGIPLSIVSIGNEITEGVLWPVGVTSDFYSLGRLLHSAAWRIKDSNLATKPKILIHLDNGWNWDTQKWWWASILAKGTLLTTDFDMMGVSYYPFYTSSATLASLKTNLTNMASTWGKELVVAETNWSAICPKPAYAFPLDTKSIPVSADGQVTWMKDVAAIVAGVSKGVGLFYWKPAWVGNAALGSSCSDNCFFAYEGTARQSLAVFASI